MRDLSRFTREELREKLFLLRITWQCAGDIETERETKAKMDRIYEELKTRGKSQ